MACPAHESPEHTIQNLGQDNQLNPAQLHQRAIARRALKQYPSAISDLKSAITRAPEQLGYQLELIRTQLTAGHYQHALHSAEHALAHAQTPAQRAEILSLKAEIHHRQHQPEQSLAAIKRAFKQKPQGEIEWYLLRSENQRSLGQSQQRISDLEAGLQQHPSAVLKSHWIDALIDAGHYQTALAAINSELKDRRWKSSYLIKRARTLRGLQHKQQAKRDLLEALEEINPRINPKHPDLLLLADQARAYSLLGQHQQARQSVARLKEHHAPVWILESAIRDLPKE